MSDKSFNPPPEVIFTIVVTFNPRTGDIRIAGNVLAHKDLALRLLIEAAHSVINNEAKHQLKPETKVDSAEN